MLLFDGQVHYDTHVIPMGNYVIASGASCVFTSSNIRTPDAMKEIAYAGVGRDLTS
jgi:hypothetical protein